jgi:hypothetical protein
MPAPHQSKYRMATEKARRPRRRVTGARQPDDLKEALGASRSFSIVSRPHGPFGVMALLDELKGRLVSRGGRPADSVPTVRRLVPLRKHVWKELQAQANVLSSLGRHVSPGQLAAMLLERSLSDLERHRGKSIAPSDDESSQKL